MSTVTGSLPTAGGANILVSGHSLGVSASAISLVYMGGLTGQPTRVFQTSACTVLVPNTNISCVSVPGVGGNLSFQIIVDGTASAWSVGTLSHSTPSIVALYGQPTSTMVSALSMHSQIRVTYAECAQGGTMVELSGLNFGPAALTPNITAWCSPSTNSSMQFYGLNCSVSLDNVGIECLTSPSVGSSLSWTVSIDGLTSQVPTYYALSPVITSVFVASSSIP